MNSSKKPIKSKPFKLRDFDFKFEAGVVFVVYLVWFTYIFGILGHVCPAAFLGIFHASLIGSVAITKKTPRFVGLFISFLLTIILWLVSFFLLHPPTADEPIITVGPFVMLVLNFIVSVLILNFFRENSNIRQKEDEEKNNLKGIKNDENKINDKADIRDDEVVKNNIDDKDNNKSKIDDENKKENEGKNDNGGRKDDEETKLNKEDMNKAISIRFIKLDGFLVNFTTSIVLIISALYIFSSDMKDLLWNDNPIKWFDTMFYEGDVYRLFLFIAFIGLFSGICSIASAFYFKKNVKIAIRMRILSYTFLGFILIGTLSMYIFFKGFKKILNTSLEKVIKTRGKQIKLSSGQSVAEFQNEDKDKELLTNE